MFLATGIALAMTPLVVYAYRDLNSVKFGIPEEIKLPHWERWGWHVPIGVNELREQYTLDFAKTPHLVLGGATRYGKSNMVHSLIVNLLRSRPNDVTFTFIDLKGGIELGRYSTLEQCHGVAEEPEDALTLLKEAYGRMRAVQTSLKLSGERKQLTPKHFVIIDEVGELNPSEAVDKEEKKLKQQCQALMSQISRLGAGLGFHLILATQYPTGDVLPRQCKQNSDAKLCFRVQSGTASKVVLDEVGAEEIPDIRGRAIFQRGADRFIVQTYLVSENDIENILEKHQRVTRREGNDKYDIIEVEATECETREDSFIIEETELSDEDATF